MLNTKRPWMTGAWIFPVIQGHWMAKQWYRQVGSHQHQVAFLSPPVQFAFCLSVLTGPKIRLEKNSYLIPQYKNLRAASRINSYTLRDATQIPGPWFLGKLKLKIAIFVTGHRPAGKIENKDRRGRDRFYCDEWGRSAHSHPHLWSPSGQGSHYHAERVHWKPFSDQTLYNL